MNTHNNDDKAAEINHQITEVTNALEKDERMDKNRQVIVIGGNNFQNKNLQDQLVNTLSEKGYQVIVFDEQEMRNGSSIQQQWLKEKIAEQGLPFVLMEKLRNQFEKEWQREMTDFLSNPMLLQHISDTDYQESYRIKGQDYPDGQYYHRFKKKF
jgi:hypothetical protein